MRKTTFLIGTILVALNVQPLHAGKMSKNQKICQEKWGAKIENVEEFINIETKWLRDSPEYRYNEDERIARKNKRDYLKGHMLYKLNDAHAYCNQNGHKYASVAYKELIEEYNEFFGSSEDE